MFQTELICRLKVCKYLKILCGLSNAKWFENVTSLFNPIIFAGYKYLTKVKQEKCRNQSHLLAKLKIVIQRGGEGLMLRKPESLYEAIRSPTLLKVKVVCP